MPVLPEKTVLLRLLDHVQGNAVLDAATGIEKFRLRENLQAGGLFQTEKGRISDQIKYVGVIHVLFLLWCASDKSCIS